MQPSAAALDNAHGDSTDRGDGERLDVRKRREAAFFPL